MRINTNVGAINAHRQLGMTQNEVSQSMAKLSSGFRINRAADDAAGLGIANVLRANTRALTQASRNADQANSLLQIAEGATSGVQKMLERMKELATQAGSETLDQAGRDRIQAEFNAMRAEINRTVDTTKFQGSALLNGTFGSVGDNLAKADVTVASTAKAGTYSISVESSSNKVTLTDAAGTKSSVTLSDDNFASGKFTLKFDNGITISADALNAEDVSSVKAAIDGRSVQVSAKLNTDATTYTLDNEAQLVASSLKVGTGAESDKTYTIAASYTAGVTTLELKIGTDVKSTITVADADLSATNTPLKFTNSAGDTIVEFGIKTIDGADAGTDVTGADLVEWVNGETVATVTDTASAVVSGNPTGPTAKFLLGSSGEYRSDDLVSLEAIDLKVDTLGLTDADLSSAVGARDALTSIDGAMDTVNQALGKIGAFQNRIENAMSNLKTSIQNYSAAESVIRDLDMAEEMTKFSKNQILSQAGTAMLAQANQSAQGILQLLRG